MSTEEGTITVSREQLRRLLDNPESSAREELYDRMAGIEQPSKMDGPLFVGPQRMMDEHSIAKLRELLGTPLDRSLHRHAAALAQDTEDLVAMLDAMGAPHEHGDLGRYTLAGRLRAWHAHVSPMLSQAAELRVHLLVEGQADSKPYACGATTGKHSGGRLEFMDCIHCAKGALEGALLELQALRERHAPKSEAWRASAVFIIAVALQTFRDVGEKHRTAREQATMLLDGIMKLEVGS